MVVDGAEFGTTANIYVWGSPADIVAKPGKIWRRDSNRRRFDRIASFEKAPIAGKSGGGGNRTRVRGRTGQSVYKLRLRFHLARTAGSQPTYRRASHPAVSRRGRLALPWRRARF